MIVRQSNCLSDNNSCQDASIEEYAVVGNRLFVLHVVARDPDDHPDYDTTNYSGWKEGDEDPAIYEISEYQGQENEPS